MSIQVQCVQCGTSHQVNDRLAGRRVRCPGCDTAIHVPELDAAAAVTAVDAEAVEVDVTEIEAVDAVVAEPVEVETVSVEATAVDESTRPPLPSVATPIAASVAGTSAPATSDGEPPSVELDDDEGYPTRPDREVDELDMTPMVDVTFLLLIFFMVTASFSLQKSIEMPRQQTDAPSTQAIEEDPEELDQVELQIDEFGGFLVLAADWEAETPGKQNLISKLKEARTDGVEGKLIIKVHEQAKLQSLVDGMDAGTIAGYAELQVTQVEQFD